MQWGFVESLKTVLALRFLDQSTRLSKLIIAISDVIFGNVLG